MYEAFQTIVHPTGTVPYDPSDTAFPTVIPNPPIIQKASRIGETALWVVFILMLIATVTFVALSWRVPAAKRLYHSITSLIAIVGTLSYFAMATKMGIRFHHIQIKESHGHGIPPTFKNVYREVYYARYIDWLLATPLLLLDLSILAGLNGASIVSAVVAQLIVIIAGLFSSFAVRKGPKWGWFTIAIVAYLWVLYTMLYTARARANAKGKSVLRFYTQLSSFALIVLTAYPIIWAVADGSRHLNVDGEIIAYGILDVLAKGVFGAWLLFMHNRVPESHVEVGGFWANGFNTEGTIRIQDDDGA